MVPGLLRVTSITTRASHDETLQRCLLGFSMLSAGRSVWSKRCWLIALEAPTLLECLQVLWLDITAAKARYGRWIDGCLPSFVPFPTSTRARTKQQKREAAVKAAARAASDLDDDSFIRLSHLRCSC